MRREQEEWVAPNCRFMELRKNEERLKSLRVSVHAETIEAVIRFSAESIFGV
jgi:hypothetical protein